MSQPVYNQWGTDKALLSAVAKRVVQEKLVNVSVYVNNATNKILQTMAYMNNLSKLFPIKVYKNLPTNNRVHLHFQFDVIFTKQYIFSSKYPFPQIMYMHIFSMLLVQVHILVCTPLKLRL